MAVILIEDALQARGRDVPRLAPPPP